MVRRSLYNATVPAWAGFTFTETMVVIATLGPLAGLAIPTYWNYIEEAKITRAIAEIAMLQKEIYAYNEKNERLPTNLADIGSASLPDPWGNPYEYLNFDTVKGYGKMRKDHHLVPINSDFDLYSMGRDGLSETPIQNPKSQDDIVRANNGTYIGLASEY